MQNLTTIDNNFRHTTSNSELKNLAAAVVIQALYDLHAATHEVRHNARLFLFAECEPFASARAHWMDLAGIRIESLGFIQRLTKEQLRERLTDPTTRKYRQQQAAA